MLSRLFSQRPGRLTIRQQQRQDDCGLACLAMIADFYEVPKAKRRFLDLNLCQGQGVTVTMLTQVARQMDLKTRAHRPSLKKLKAVSLPCVVLWNHNHYVTLAEISDDGVLIHDPGLGRVRYSWREFQHGYSRICIEFSPTLP